MKIIRYHLSAHHLNGFIIIFAMGHQDLFFYVPDRKFSNHNNLQ